MPTTIFKAILSYSNKIKRFQRKVNINALKKRALSLPKPLAPALGCASDGFDCTEEQRSYTSSSALSASSIPGPR